MKVWILGIGMGPQHVTAEVRAALRGCDYVVAADKRPGAVVKRSDDGSGPPGPDPLLAVRAEVAASCGVEMVVVADPERDRVEPADYVGAVADWHEQRIIRYENVFRERGGVAAFLVWGDPALYDSTIRIVEAVAARMDLEYEVLPGISAPQLLAARHRVVLHPVGEPVHICPARRLADAVNSGQRNIVVMLGAGLDLTGLGEWWMWWGANLGTAAEELLAGQVAAVAPDLVAARDRARRQAGWVLDIALLRAPDSIQVGGPLR